MRFYKHHIIPLHEWRIRINPNVNRTDKDFNSPDNVVWLSLQQHAQAHQFLYELNGKSEDLVAWKGTAGIMGHEDVVREVCRIAAIKGGKSKPSPETKERMRLAALERWNRPGQREAQRERNMGIKNPCFGKPQSAESNKKRSATQSGIPKTSQHKAKISAAQKGIARPQTSGLSNGNYRHGLYVKVEV
jgi:hypothetical protein